MIVEPVVMAANRESNRTYDDLRARWSNWLWAICQRDEEDAERARAILIEAIDAHHLAARALVASVAPKRGRTITDRPASADEMEG